MKLRRYVYGHLDWGSWLFGIEVGRCDFDTALRYGIRFGPIAVGVWFGRIDIVRLKAWTKDTPGRLKSWWEWQRLSPEERRRRKQEEREHLLAFREDAKARLKAWTVLRMDEAMSMRDMGIEP